MTLKNCISVVLVLSGMAASSSVREAVASGEVELCGTQEPSEEHRAMSEATLEHERTLPGQRKPFAVDLYFHIVASGESHEDGNVSDGIVTQQLAVINSAYAPHGISFNHIETTRTVNELWASGGDIDAMKQELRQGPYAALNVYTINQLPSGALGYCPFPEQQVTEGDAVFIEDGCTIIAGSLPGGNEDGYNEGGILVHEIGHWMDVFHTFQFGCFPGDYNDDTPPMSETPSLECDPNVVYDTCPNDPGTDPIHNYMNYTGDLCWDEFTPGQEARMHSAWKTYRMSSI